MNNTTDMVHKLGFADDEIAKCLDKKGLLSIELEFTRKCNLRCLYCYSSAGEAVENELGLDELKAVVYQARELGAKKIILLGGGEPLLYHGVMDVVDYIHSLGLQQVLFTNGTLITREIAQFLFKKNVSVIMKSNSMISEVQDVLAGATGVFQSIRKGLQLLKDTGYPDNNVSLGIQTIICRQNIAELPSLWTWARENRIIPYFEILTYQGRAKDNAGLEVSVPEIKALFDRLAAIDKEKFGMLWKSHPTIAAFSCKRHFYSCLINSRGYVQPCPGIDMFIGNIREKPLREILATSAVITDLRNVYEKIEGPCKTCEHRQECYGCRGNAYQITGNYLSSDPTCWRLKKNEANLKVRPA
ncbi:MAG: radical SAM protein [Planctomycetota bacterium]